MIGFWRLKLWDWDRVREGYLGYWVRPDLKGEIRDKGGNRERGRVRTVDSDGERERDSDKKNLMG